MTKTTDKKKRPLRGLPIVPDTIEFSPLLTGGDGIPRRRRRRPEDVFYGPDPAPAPEKPRRDPSQSAEGPRSAADTFYDHPTSREDKPDLEPVKTRRDPPQTTAAPRTTGDVFFGKNEPTPKSRPGTGIATNDGIKGGSRLGQQGRREDTDTDIWGVKWRKASAIDPKTPQVAEAFVEGLVDRSTSPSPSTLDDIGTIGRIYFSAPPQDVADAEKDIRALREIADRRGFPFPVRLLDHFLDGSGTPFEIPREVAFGLGPVADAQAVNQERFGSTFLGEGGVKTKEAEQKLLALQDGGEPTEFDDHWDKVITGFGKAFTGEWSTAFGLGDVQLDSNGFFKAWRSGDTITIIGRVKHSIEEPYNFEKDKWPENIVNRGLMLQTKGTAKTFMMRSEWAQDVIVTIEVVNGELQEPRFKWIDEPAHMP